MDSSQGGNSSAADALVASTKTDFHFDRGYRGRLQQVFPGEQDASAAVLRWEYCVYAE